MSIVTWLQDAFAEIRISTFYLLVLVGFLLLMPIPGAEFAWLFFSLPLFLYLRSRGRIADLSLLKDGALMAVYTFGVVVAVASLGLFAITQVSLGKLVLLGLLIDGVNSALAIVFPVPFLSDAVAALLVSAITTTFISGPIGLFLAFIMGFIALIPGPSVLLHTISLIALKTLTGVFG